MEPQSLLDNNSLSRLIAEKITEQIITGELRPGDKIVESTYAREFGTSRAPIREALYLLMIEGLVVRIPRRGTLVKGYSEQEIYDILEIRMMLETLAVRRIAEFGTNDLILHKMKTLISQMESAVNDSKKYAELNRQFHLMILEMSKNEIIKNVYLRLGVPLLALQRLSFLEEGNIHRSLEEHRVILQLLQEKRFDRAIDVLERHNGAVKERVERRVKGAIQGESFHQQG